MPRYIDADEIQYTMLYKENWITNTGVEKQGVWKDDIDKMPTADVRENVKGKWIKKKGSLWSLATCSVCGELSVEGDKPFCPNCGAQMIGDKENDERI